MSEEQLKAFWEAVQADTSLQAKLRATTDADSIANAAKEAGFEITAAEVEEAQAQLSDEQLKGAAGGRCACVCSQAAFCNDTACMTAVIYNEDGTPRNR